jgi:sarcosine oxidase subunit beta
MTADTRPESVAVVGGGAVGLTAAARLADRGVAVTLYERETLGSGATGRAAGLCYDAYADRADARIAARSLAAFRECGALSERPYVWVARAGDDTAEAVREQVAQMQQRGLDVTLFEPADLGARFPALETSHLAVGAVAENAGVVDTDAYLAAMECRATDCGVAVETQTPVGLLDERTVETPVGERGFDAVLLAAGAHTDGLAAMAGHSLALGRYRTQALVTDAVVESPPLFYDASARFYLRPAGDGLLVGDGTSAYDGRPDEVATSADAAFLEASVARVETALGETPDCKRSWAGLCTATPDGNPLVGHCGDGLYVATGWHGHGLMRAPAFGEAIAEEMTGGSATPRFAPNRFDGDESIHLPAEVDS